MLISECQEVHRLLVIFVGPNKAPSRILVLKTWPARPLAVGHFPAEIGKVFTFAAAANAALGGTTKRTYFRTNLANVLDKDRDLSVNN